MDIPDYIRDALKKADVDQQEAWLGINAEICGIPVCQMTLKQYYILDGLECPFLYGKGFTPADIATFLWILSPDFSLCRKARKKFIEKVAKITIHNADKEIREYIETTFSDLDTLQEDKKSKLHSSYLAYQIDLYAKEYGWSIKEILDMPIRQSFQLNTAIAERYARINGKSYTKMRAVDAAEAKAILDMAKKRKPINN